MFLKKVEISGFKSFANKTSLEFSPSFAKASEGKAGGFENGKKRGITAIVGPNGSGKSNVADAIRWVMGEQSMKNLRGKKSEDIIFAGSGKKARLGSAIATLHFDNSDKRIPLEFSEVTITRKLFRSGESDYLINGSRVRLLDIVDLLAKAGIGRESYCVINQGMSDAVLSASPTERRMILEDAAGVKHYQIKKERSLRKLELTKTNLERVKDLIKEIEPHLRMLKRQSDKAQKGKDVTEKLRKKQIALYSYLWHSFQKEQESFTEEKRDKGAKMMNLQREADKITDALNEYSKEIQSFHKQDECERKRNDLYQKINELEKELVITEGRIVIEEERQKNQSIIESIPVDLGYVRSKLERIRRNQEQLIERLQRVEKIEELQDIKEFSRAIQQELFDLYEEVGKGKIEVKPVVNKEGKKLAELQEHQKKLRSEVGKYKTEIEKVGKAIDQEVEKNRKLRQRFFDLERSLNAKQLELNKLKDEFNEAKVRMAKVEVRREDLTNEIRNSLRLEPEKLSYSGEALDTDALEQEIHRLKMQIEQIGGIDPMIVEEYEETKKRFEFLSGESEDLEKAIQSLKEIIKEMDRKIDSIFAQAFSEINKEFTKYFRIIFGGGQAHLIKSKLKAQSSKLIKDNNDTREEQELETEQESEEKEELGIDIFACPPGKRINSLAMLSGGERSLTSLALLFAIISHNPPPFAVLDEVEAALDEANSRRFGRIIQELSNHTQFIIITHNRETIRQASLLYGVTMGEDGVSKLLSVRLDQVGQGGKIIRH